MKKSETEPNVWTGLESNFGIPVVVRSTPGRVAIDVNENEFSVEFTAEQLAEILGAAEKEARAAEAENQLVLVYYTREEATEILDEVTEDLRKTEAKWRAEADSFTYAADPRFPKLFTPRQTAADWRTGPLSEYIQTHWGWAEVIRDLDHAFQSGAELIGVYRPRYRLTEEDIRESDELYRSYTGQDVETLADEIHRID